MTIQLILGDSTNEMPVLYDRLVNFENKKICVVTDPPFNVGYHYNSYNDDLPEDEYYNWLKEILTPAPKVIIHYPEALHRLSIELNQVPTRVISWVYNSNTARQHRDIAYYGIKPDFSRVKQPYKNLNDKRIKKRIAQGQGAASLYDWFEINQIKNVSKDTPTLNHPCIMPLEVMINVIGTLPEETIIIDPFLGSGTSGLACKMLGYDFIGIEKDPLYFELASDRINKNMVRKNLKILDNSNVKPLDMWGVE